MDKKIVRCLNEVQSNMINLMQCSGENPCFIVMYRLMDCLWQEFMNLIFKTIYTSTNASSVNYHDLKDPVWKITHNCLEVGCKMNKNFQINWSLLLTLYIFLNKLYLFKYFVLSLCKSFCQCFQSIFAIKCFGCLQLYCNSQNLHMVYLKEGCFIRVGHWTLFPKTFNQ